MRKLYLFSNKVHDPNGYSRTRVQVRVRGGQQVLYFVREWMCRQIIVLKSISKVIIWTTQDWCGKVSATVREQRETVTRSIFWRLPGRTSADVRILRSTLAGGIWAGDFACLSCSVGDTLQLVCRWGCNVSGTSLSLLRRFVVVPSWST